MRKDCSSLLKDCGEINTDNGQVNVTRNLCSSSGQECFYEFALGEVAIVLLLLTILIMLAQTAQVGKFTISLLHFMFGAFPKPHYGSSQH